ncbi:nitroimidazol reductase NimA-like FMN-containing flavoprotein (pyridoxamine 5'-phosphate oxidase superfamily) [Caulobacter ginsengisoli]|uniref:Nitroimidazol reductase NimA-like FMN-containing flavoprotein (Pyridoxamine 5'-phosphate oxidase superfamily) n=1 Tax=Caulobacter ginsengisoli TaxID=400775 RepID=A0ABU0IQS4_9CAUL|nr:pyridoxamine 5'-phosphate oxidase family protein [Caulobacter ginsengisoli]MDQ0464366.1 nitroimidazol reductase NimA-like FMN-containing flavoprotein (pyridoxamine 5'-phosphate oxidase superfamily) [Caulobacter ginsengisoli]
MSSDFIPTDRSQVRRRPQRAAYDEASVFAILDAGLMAHVGYVIDGQPFVTPTSYWREGRTLYWHGSAGGRALAAQAGLPVCVTVSHLDGLIVARSGIAHSAQYRSVMAFGRARLVQDRQAKRAAMAAFIDRLYPGRWAGLRPTQDAELDAISVVAMEIEEAAAKVKAEGVARLPIDETWDGWRGVIPVRQVLGAAEPVEEAEAPPLLALYRAGARLDETLAAAAQA